jgi:hypothetical protein
MRADDPMVPPRALNRADPAPPGAPAVSTVPRKCCPHEPGETAHGCDPVTRQVFGIAARWKGLNIAACERADEGHSVRTL